ncbi:MAG: hypothetical protein QME07_07800 [bacterium]|nr:hypothetical protein [bacterium]
MEERKIWINRPASPEDTERFERDYYLKMTKSERLSTVQFLRDMHSKIKGESDEGREGLRRVIKIAKQS